MNYTNFRTALYVTVYELRYIDLQNLSPLTEVLDFIEKHVRLDKVYIETCRCATTIDKEKLLKVKDLFNRRGMATSGGITLSQKPGNTKGWSFKSLCYSDEKQLEEVRQVVKFTAEIFDEVIFDDFYFYNCKCPSCIAQKGPRSWSQFRMERMSFVAEEIIIKSARQVNPRASLIIKYPNWYDEYQFTGYDLEKESEQFDMIYTGTETRNPYYTQQSLQRYTGYFLMRYLEHVKPGKNGGGWFDNIDSTYNLGAFAEQAYLTLFAKPREVTLFSLGILWQRSIFVPVAGYVFDALDKFLGKLGNPTGIACYKPYHSAGEKYLHGYLGMLGLPLEPQPDFPVRSPLVLLTESAAVDPHIIDKIKQQLLAGKNVVITSGFVRAKQGEDLGELAEVQYSSRKVAVREFACFTRECAFKSYYRAAQPILIPEFEFPVNDCTQMIVAFNEHNNFPLLLKTSYGQGKLFILTVPENYGDLYNYPPEVLNTLRHVLMENADAGPYVSLEGPSQIGLFTYDNHTFVIESFLPYNQDVTIVINKEGAVLEDLVSGVKTTGQTENGKTCFALNLLASQYLVFSYT